MYGSNQVYTEQCCQPEGNYQLVCKDVHGNGWHGGFVRINGKRYCRKFKNGNEKIKQVAMSGKSNCKLYVEYTRKIKCNENLIFHKILWIFWHLGSPAEPTEAPTQTPPAEPTKAPPSSGYVFWYLLDSNIIG